MRARNYYVKLAIAGTGQEGKKPLDVAEISDYLQAYAEIVEKENWESWLKRLGLHTMKEIKGVIHEIRSEEIWKS